jgi:16S rRNA (adenine(1408)-N(1))-methyltransferase
MEDMEIIRGRRSYAIDADEIAVRAWGHDQVLLDLGTGDGRFVRHMARLSPERLAIGVDACRENLRAVSRTAPPNAVYVIANVLALPCELAGLASQITINFPWGSLLHGLLDDKQSLLQGIAAAARLGAVLELRLNAGALEEAGWTLEAGGQRIRRVLDAAGFESGSLAPLDRQALRSLPCTWARRLAFGRDPRGLYLRATTGPTRVPAVEAPHARAPPLCQHS